MEVIIKYSGDLDVLESQLGAGVEILNEHYAIVTLRPEQLAQLKEYLQVEYVELPKTLTASLFRSLRKVCVSGVHENPAYDLRGKGVLVAIIDSGVDYTHPDFCNPDGSSRIVSIWDQTVPGNPPQGFTHGAEYHNEQLNEALASATPYEIVPSMDDIGHGTAVAGIAAGNGRASGGSEKGVAPESTIIVVKLGEKGRASFARTTEIMRAFKYVFDKAVALHMPLAVNLSYGTNNGSHDGNSLFESYISEIAQTHKAVIAVATGNEGSAGHHYFAAISQRQSITVDFTTAGGLSSFFVSLWKNFVDTFTFELIWPNGQSSGVIYPNHASSMMTVAGVALSVIHGQPTPYNASQEVYFLFEGKIPRGLWKLIVTGVQVTDGRFDAWLPTVEEVSRDTAFLMPATNTTLTLPSTAKNVIAVCGYNAILESIVAFSGRGLTRDDAYQKPDIAAPTVDVITTRTGGGYGTFTGTSMSAPFVTGAAALLMQWGIVNENDLFLYGQRVKAFLQKNAAKKPDLVYPNPLWGYGTLCVQAAVDDLMRFQGGTQYG